MPLESLKLTKQVLNGMTDAGYTEALEIQERTLSRIIGGQDIVAVGPEGSGKTTALVLGVLMRLKYSQDEPPRALILVPDKERVLAMEERFRSLGKQTGIKVFGLYAGVGLEGQKDALAEGADVVIGTPDRVHSIYLKSGLNVNRIKMFILDDADYIVKQGFQTLVHQIADRLPKCQHLVFTEVFHAKLEKLTSPFLNFPVTIEVNQLTAEAMETIDLVLYQTPNYKTKLNLLNLLMPDAETFSKGVVFVNTNITADSIYKSMNKRNMGEVGMLRSKDPGTLTFESVEDFMNDQEVRILVALNEEPFTEAFTDIPFLLHFDVPVTKEIFIQRAEKKSEEQFGQIITFSTDIELTLIAKIEQAMGKKIEVEALPPGLIVEGDRHSHKDDGEDSESHDIKGGAFQEKKASNAKTHNYTYKDRLKMFGKKHRKNKRGE